MIPVAANMTLSPRQRSGRRHNLFCALVSYVFSLNYMAFSSLSVRALPVPGIVLQFPTIWLKQKFWVFFFIRRVIRTHVSSHILKSTEKKRSKKEFNFRFHTPRKLYHNMTTHELGLGSFLRWLVRMGKSCQNWPNIILRGT